MKVYCKTLEIIRIVYIVLKSFNKIIYDKSYGKANKLSLKSEKVIYI